jgi:predicted phosphodiesterase
MKLPFFPAFFAIVSIMVSSVAHAGGPGGPIVKGPWMQHVTPTSAIVRVEVDPPAPVTLELGMSGVVGTADSGVGSVVESREVRGLHSILVQNLAPATRYTFTVRAGGAQKYGAVTTAPADDRGAPFRFLIYGDNRTDDTAHASIVRAMVAAPSDFLVHTGDFVDKGASAAQWQTFFDIEAPLLRERCLFSCVGNHELVDGAGAEYVRYFGPAEVPVAVPKPASSFAGPPIAIPLPVDAGQAPLSLEQLSGTYRWSNARFFLVNGMVDYATGPTRAWLEKALTDSDKEPGLVWRIVVVHHGAWSSGPHGDNAHLHEGKVPDLLRAHKVDLVIAGHDHIYERGTADGLAYLVSGGGGAPVYRVKKAQATSRHYESVRHFVDASASAAAIQFVATRPDGSTIERCALRKGAGWDCDGANPAVPSPSGAASGGSTLPPEAPAVSKSKCGCHTVGTDAGGGAAAGVALLCLATLARRRRWRAPRNCR